MEDFETAVLKDYPYHAKDETCLTHKVSYRPGPKLSTYIEHTHTSNDDLKGMVVNNPVSVALEAQHWKFYDSGIFDDVECGEDIDHGVVVVGFNSDENYWKIKNSWGPRWGESGFIRIRINPEKEGFTDGTCGILNRPSYPVLKS